MTDVQWFGLYLATGSAATLLLCALVAWGNRNNPARTFELPGFVVRVEDYLRSAHDCDVKR